MWRTSVTTLWRAEISLCCQNGTLVYFNGQAALEKWAISSVDPAGRSKRLHAPPGRYVTPRFSPDGRRLAFSASNEKESDIWVKDLDRDLSQKLTFLPGDNGLPVWTPDGRAIVFGSTNPGAPGLYAVRSDGSGEAKRLTEGRPVEMPNSFSPDGRRLAIHTAGTNGSFDIFTAPVVAETDGGGPGFRLGKPELFLGTPGYESRPAFSPDGHWLAYGSNELRTNEVYVRPFPGPGGRWQVSTEGGRNASWSRDGRELLFESFDRRVMTAAYPANGDAFVVRKPRAWAETRLRQTNGTYSYDLTPDGKRMAAIPAGDSEEKPLTHLTFLLNFFDELRRKAPAGN